MLPDAGQGLAYGSRTLTGAVYALLAALSWGGGDFAGGMGAKAAGGNTRGALRMMVAAHGLSLLVLSVLLAVRGHVALTGAPVLWGLGSGVVAGLALAAFYVALAQGEMGSSAAISGLLAAAIPAGVGIMLEGRPTALRLLGFVLAAVAIWMVAAPAANGASAKSTDSSGNVMILAIAGGVGFGLYFTGLKFANTLGVLEPLALARVGSIAISVVLLALLWIQGRKGPAGGPWLSRAGWFWAAGVAVLDSGGNLLYIAATRAGRLDVAAVLAALYPASTILLAAAVLHERPGRRQVFGMCVALGAVVLVTL